MVEADERSRVEQSVQRIPNCNLPSGSQEYSTGILPSKSRGTRQSRGFGVLGKGRTEPSVRVQRQYDLHAHTCHASVQASYNAAPGSATICVDWCVCVSVCVRACMRACMRAQCGCVNACHWHALVHEWLHTRLRACPCAHAPGFVSNSACHVGSRKPSVDRRPTLYCCPSAVTYRQIVRSE
jgi:hypothetical protein